MYKSELIRYLQESIKNYGDSEVLVEITNNLNFKGDVYKIEDLVTVSEDYKEIDYILCFK